MEIQEFKKRFGARVQAARLRRGLSQERLAEQIGKSKDMISQLERGINATRIEVVLQIAEVLDTSILDLLDVEQVGPRDRKTGHLVNRLLDLVGDQSDDFLTAVIDQVEVLRRVRAVSAGER